MILKSDQEPSIVALRNEVKKRWALSSGGELLPESSPKGESKSNGEVERAVQEVHGISRTLKEYVEFYAEIVLDPHWPIMAWLVGYSTPSTRRVSRTTA